MVSSATVPVMAAMLLHELPSPAFSIQVGCAAGTARALSGTTTHGLSWRFQASSA